MPKRPVLRQLSFGITCAFVMTCAVSASQQMDGTCRDSGFPWKGTAGAGAEEDVKIPSFSFEFRSDFDLIKANLMSNHTVQMGFWWSFPQSSTVTFDLFTNPLDFASNKFAADMSGLPLGYDSDRYREYLLLGNGSSVTFRNYLMSIQNGTRLGCENNFEQPQQCYNDCTNNGRYCFITNTTSNKSMMNGGEIRGRDIVRESLRRYCLAIDSRSWSVYFRYVAIFTEECMEKGRFSDPDCINSAYEKAGLYPFTSCIGDLDQDTPNEVLEEALGYQRYYNVVTVPTILLNGVIMRKSLTLHNVLEEVCQHLEQDLPLKPASVCLHCRGGGASEDLATCIRDALMKKKKKKSTKLEFPNWLLFLLTNAIGLLAGYLLAGGGGREKLCCGTTTTGSRSSAPDVRVPDLEDEITATVSQQNQPLLLGNDDEATTEARNGDDPQEGDNHDDN